jgi:hypothetical protein
MAVLETYKGVYLWKYLPSVPAAIIFAILYALPTVALVYKMSKHRTWFTIPFVLGGFCTCQHPHNLLPHTYPHPQ